MLKYVPETMLNVKVNVNIISKVQVTSFFNPPRRPGFL